MFPFLTVDAVGEYDVQCGVIGGGTSGQRFFICTRIAQFDAHSEISPLSFYLDSAALRLAIPGVVPRSIVIFQCPNLCKHYPLNPKSDQHQNSPCNFNAF